MMHNVTMKEVRDGYVNVNAATRVIGEDSLEDKADLVLTIPVENLLMLVSNKTHLPFAGLTGMGHQPLAASDVKDSGAQDGPASSTL